MESRFVLETPLMWIDKAQTWALAEQLGGVGLVDLIRYDIVITRIALGRVAVP
jgi:7-cyano-7-deazaguanine synthase